MTRSFTWHGITLRAGMHLWSNPARRGTEAAVPVVMRAPTLLDLVVLAEQKPVEELARINERLYAQGEISARQRATTEDFLTRIDRANHARAAALR
ncbi:hypothetical protein [Cupriavidus sp. TMH.W2]|uniref:hypothetical protein n=1 Tax=Cupriavidus sp. TMH.W2 TaxID=3434465 RepID=UPI003D771DBD